MVKGPDIFIPPLTGKEEQQRFPMQNGIRQLCKIIGHPLPNERTLDPQSAARETHICPSQPEHPTEDRRLSRPGWLHTQAQAVTHQSSNCSFLTHSVHTVLNTLTVDFVFLLSS